MALAHLERRSRHSVGDYRDLNGRPPGKALAKPRESDGMLRRRVDPPNDL